jgi:hypothetical protein
MPRVFEKEDHFCVRQKNVYRKMYRLFGKKITFFCKRQQKSICVIGKKRLVELLPTDSIVKARWQQKGKSAGKNQQNGSSGARPSHGTGPSDSPPGRVVDSLDSGAPKGMYSPQTGACLQASRICHTDK